MGHSIEQFVESLDNSGLLSARDVARFRESLPDGVSTQSAEELVQALVQEDVLTPFQAERIRAGQLQELVFGNYVVLDKLGEGGMGQVFKARHRRMDRIVALKVLPPNVTSDEHHLKRFQREIRVVARLAHPNIVQAYDADEAHHEHFMVTEFVDGCDLSALVKACGPLDVETAVQCILQACRGLSYAHSQGVVHRDIKPANLMLDKSGALKILDLGLATLDDQLATEDPANALTKSGSVMGTADFIAPEQALNTKNADSRSDIYSLGATLFYLLNGQPPYGGKTIMEKLLAHRDSKIPSLQAHNQNVPEALDSVFTRMVAKQPDDRYQTIGDLLVDLKPIAVSAGDCIQGVQLMSGDLLPCKELSSIRQSLSATTSLFKDTKSADIDEPATRLDVSDSMEADTLRPSTLISTPMRNGYRTPSLILLLAVLLLLGSVTFFRFFDVNPREPDNSQPPEGAVAHSPVEEGHVDRSVAEWVLQRGGTLEVSLDATERKVVSSDELPDKPFRITAIDLSKSPLVSDDNLVRLKELERLQSLELANTDIGDAGLEHIRSLTTLDRLDLEATRVTDEGLSILNDLHGIKELDLENTALTDHGLTHLRQLSQLQDLNIEKTAITDEGLAHLAELTTLRKLDIEKTEVTDAGLLHLAGLHRLRELSVNGPGITDEGVAKLQTSLPTCRIQH